MSDASQQVSAIRLEALREAYRACQGVVDYFREHGIVPSSGNACLRTLEALIGEKPQDRADEIAREIFGYQRNGVCVDARFIAAIIRARTDGGA